MLTELNIRNFAIIDELKVTFDGGLNIISGETGAGKSIIIGAVGLLLGDRASADMIRSYEDAAVVEALFDIRDQDGLMGKVREMGFGDGDQLAIRRIVSRSGKNRVYINGVLAALSSLATIAESLINICGQHEHQMILDVEHHIDILDELGGLTALRATFRESYDRYRSLQGRLRELDELQRKREEREELLRFQCSEISQAAVRMREDETLLEERKILVNVQKLMDHAAAAYEVLYGKGQSVLTEFRGAVSAIREIRKIDGGLKLTEQEMDELYYRIEDAAMVLRDYGKRLSFDPARLEAIEERLEFLGRLKRKYGGSLDAVLRRQVEAEEELGRIASLDAERDTVSKAMAVEREKTGVLAEALSVRRRTAADTLKAAVEQEIRALRMENARFECVFSHARERSGDAVLNEKGMDELEFYLAANVGEGMKPLRGIASGGELSRIMLALKNVLARTGSVGTIVFDEVDSGIGGATAEIVGQKLQEVSRHHQVLCITHLPQIACFGDRHYRVVKRVREERTNTTVDLLSAEGRLEEITRMLGGVALTQKTRDHAREMLLSARRRSSLEAGQGGGGMPPAGNEKK